MARCHSCNTYLGLGIFSKWVSMDGFRFCSLCAEPWEQQRQRELLETICSGQPPVDLFTLPRIRARNPDRPQARERLLGLLAFTDKGICFIQISSEAKADIGWGVAFGVLGALLAQSAAKRRQGDSLNVAEKRIVEPATDFVDLLHRAERVLFYPKEQITKLRVDSAGVMVQCDRKKHGFGLIGGRKAFRPFKELAEAYRDAVESQTDPALACKYLERPDSC